MMMGTQVTKKIDMERQQHYKMLTELQKLDRDNERALMSLYALLGRPTSHLDLGSGTGAMVRLARQMGVDALGVDLLAHYPDVEHDLRLPLNLGRRFQLVTCIEVAEHLPAAAARTLCETIARHMGVNGRLVFSSALPGQSGNGHVNCQPPQYWRDLLYDVGKFSLRQDLTAQLALLWTYTTGAAAAWLPANVQVF